jgi:hypothetical protein
MAPSTTDTDQATFGRYAETPYDQMTPEQQEGYRILATAEGGELPQQNLTTDSPYQPHRRNPAQKPTPEARCSALPLGRISAAICHMLAGRR